MYNLIQMCYFRIALAVRISALYAQLFLIQLEQTETTKHNFKMDLFCSPQSDGSGTGGYMAESWRAGACWFRVRVNNAARVRCGRRSSVSEALTDQCRGFDPKTKQTPKRKRSKKCCTISSVCKKHEYLELCMKLSNFNQKNIPNMLQIDSLNNYDLTC